MEEKGKEKSAYDIWWGLSTIGMILYVRLCVLKCLCLPEAACSVAQHLGGMKVELAVLMVIGGGVPIWLWYDDAIGQNSQCVLDDGHLQSITRWQVPEYTCTHMHTRKETHFKKSIYFTIYFYTISFVINIFPRHLKAHILWNFKANASMRCHISERCHRKYILLHYVRLVQF